MTHRTSLAILRIAALVVIGTGLLMLLAVLGPAEALFAMFLDLAFLPVDGAPSALAAETRLLAGIAAGLMAGWGATLWLIASRVANDDPGLATGLIVPGLIVWFVVDGIGSIAAGAWFNAVLNGGFLALFAVPLLAARRRPAARV